MSMNSLTTFASAVLLALLLTACGGNGTEPDAGSSTQAAEEAHEHGPDTHTHEMTPDTAGTYADTSGTFFRDEDSTNADHEHGADTHVH